MKNKVNCTNICVECVANDPVDIRCGGPKYLGFDFPVKDTELEEMKSALNILKTKIIKTGVKVK